MQNLLVTGGAGFIGSHLVERLLEDGASVTVLDDLSSGSLANLGRVRSHPRFRFVRGSVTDRAALDEAAAGRDRIFHLAAVVGVRRAVEQAVDAQRNLLHGTESVLECARSFGLPVVLASSSEVYGKGVSVPFHEDDDLRLGSPAHARWGYGAAKAMGEFLARSYQDAFGVRVAVVRLFNTIGPRQASTGGMVVPRFVRQALRGEPMTVYGDGEQRRCFTDVRDTVEALVRLARVPEAYASVVNVGSDHEVRILDLAHEVRVHCESSSEVRIVPYREAYPRGFEDVRRRVPDLSRLERWTGFRPSRPLGDTLDWIVENEAGVDGRTPSRRGAEPVTSVAASR